MSCFLKRGFLLLCIFCISFSQANAQFRAIPTIDIHTEKCDFCLVAQGISPLELGRTGVRYDVRYLRLGDQYHEGMKVANPTQDAETHFTNQFTLLYRLLDNLSAIAIVPFASRHESVLDDNGVNSTLSNIGLADVSLLSRYNVLVDHAFANTRIVALTAGVKLATGNTSKRNETGALADAHLQLGTGSTDLLIGSTALLGFEDFTIGATLLAGITGKGANNHQFGNNLNYALTGRYRIYPSTMEGPTFFATLGFLGEDRAHEKADGVDDPNSGGNVTYLAPGVQIFFSPAFSFEASFQYPFLHELNGDQLGESFRIMSGLQYMF
jgi:hypothetical protein